MHSDSLAAQVSEVQPDPHSRGVSCRSAPRRIAIFWATLLEALHCEGQQRRGGPPGHACCLLAYVKPQKRTNQNAMKSV